MEFIAIMGVVFFISVVAFIVFVIARSVSEWSANNNSPVETLNAVVVAKRTQVSGGGNDTMASTYYYVTFELESGERIELRAKANQYGMIAEGDRGVLTLQGTRFLDFERSSGAFEATDPMSAVHKCEACGATFRGTVCEYCGTPVQTAQRGRRW